MRSLVLFLASVLPVTAFGQVPVHKPLRPPSPSVGTRTPVTVSPQVVTGPVYVESPRAAPPIVRSVAPRYYPQRPARGQAPRYFHSPGLQQSMAIGPPEVARRPSPASPPRPALHPPLASRPYVGQGMRQEARTRPRVPQPVLRRT